MLFQYVDLQKPLLLISSMFVTPNLITPEKPLIDSVVFQSRKQLSVSTTPNLVELLQKSEMFVMIQRSGTTVGGFDLTLLLVVNFGLKTRV